MSLKTVKIAQQYLKAGYSPIPIKPGKKRPIITGWQEYANKTVGYEEAKTMFANTDSIGLVCGFADMEVLDIDSKHFTGDEMSIFEAMLEDNAPGMRAKMTIQDTVSGGQHWIYRCKEIQGNLKLAKNINGETTFETRGRGGQIVAYPSPGYTFRTKGDLQYITPQERAILHSCCRDMDAVLPEVAAIANINGIEQEKIHSPWGDYRRDHTALDELLKYGWTIVRENERYIYVKRPGTTTSEDSGRIFKDSGLFWPWTTSTEFTAERPYDAFHIYILMEHNGDMNKAVAALSKLGYGKQYAVTYDATKELLIDELNDEEENILQERLNEFEVDSTKNIERPPVAIDIVTGVSTSIFGTLGNFSMVQGKAKSRKSFFVSALAAGALSKEVVADSLRGHIGDKVVVYVDTEQGEYHAYRTKKRILHMAGLDTDINDPRLRYFQFRGLDRNSERMTMVEYILHTIENIGLIVLDGIVDLSSKGVNDEEEATEIASRLLKWTSHYNCHAVCVLHENKSDQNAKGHLGAYLTQKAESVVAVRRHEENREISLIKVEYSRNMEFPELQMEIAGNDIFITEHQAESFYEKPHEWTHDDLVDIAHKIKGKSKGDSLEFIRFTRDCKKREAINALILMESGKIIRWLGKRPKIVKLIELVDPLPKPDEEPVF